MDLLGGLGSLVSSALGFLGTKDTNDTNVGLNRENRSWMAEMSNTSYQRAVNDMQLAGLNPMLAYSQGGASTPTNAAPVVQNKIGGALAGAAQGAQVVQALEQVSNTAAQTENVKAQTDKVRSETLEKEINSARAWAELFLTHERTRKEFTSANIDEITAQVQEILRAQRQLELDRDRSTFSADVARRKAESTLTELEIPKSKAEASFYGKVGDLPMGLKMLVDFIRGGSSAASVLRRR